LLVIVSVVTFVLIIVEVTVTELVTCGAVTITVEVERTVEVDVIGDGVTVLTGVDVDNL
jgi:hypothetical protein